ncbi:MAG: hypothetical protein IPI34_15450 [bacterium]|nr:hypothetical protein [bacterium]
MPVHQGHRALGGVPDQQRRQLVRRHQGVPAQLAAARWCRPPHQAVAHCGPVVQHDLRTEHGLGAWASAAARSP